MKKIIWPTVEQIEQSGDYYRKETPARNEKRRIVRVECEPTQTTLCGHVLRKGENFLLVYESELPKVQERVRTDYHKEMMALAQRTWELQFAEHLKNSASEEEARATMGLSPQSLFVGYPGCKKGMPPLLSMEVCETVFDAPETKDNAREKENKVLADAIAEGIAKALAALGAAQPAKQK